MIVADILNQDTQVVKSETETITTKYVTVNITDDDVLRLLHEKLKLGAGWSIKSASYSTQGGDWDFLLTNLKDTDIDVVLQHVEEI